jgi:hypothetical protein
MEVKSPPRVPFLLEYFNSEKEQIFEQYVYLFYDGSVVMELSDSGQSILSGTAANASV